MAIVKPASQLPIPEIFPPFTALRAFDAVARLGGVRKAADALAIHHSAISRHLKTIEQWTGSTLVVREGRGVTLTEDGWCYYRKLAPALEALAEATVAMKKPQEEGKLVIWSRPGIAAEWLVPRLDDLREACPGLQLELKPSQTSPEFSKREVDLFIQYSSSFDPDPPVEEGLRALEFVRTPVIPVASPKYLASYTPVECPSDFLRHRLIDDERDDTWGRWFDLMGVPRSASEAGPRFWHPGHALEAVRMGEGIFLSMLFLAQADLDAGTLVELKGKQGRYDARMIGRYWLIGREDDWDNEAIAQFRQWIVSATHDGDGNLAPPAVS